MAPESPGRAAARAMAARTWIGSEDEASVDGHPVAPGRGTDDGPPLVDGLRRALYAACYAGLPWPTVELPPPSEELAEELRRANAGRDAWEGGWRFVRWAGQAAAVSSWGGRLRAWPHGTWLRDDARLGPVVDDTPLRIRHVAAPRPRGGFWFAGGHGGPDPAFRMLRLYFNVGRRGAAPLVAHLTARLHALEVPFNLKVADRDELFVRRDSAVLYTEARHVRIVGAVARELLARLPEPLAPEVPPFAKRLAPGVGAAEDGGDGGSFGDARCAAVARGLWAAHEAGDTGEDARVAAVETAFAAAGLDLDRPWLASREHPDRYELPV